MKRKAGVKYCRNTEEQLRWWLEGDSRHNSTLDECCPDFSCCQPELQWGADERKTYVEAYNTGDEQVRDSMNQTALVRAIEHMHTKDSDFNREDSPVYVAGCRPGDDEEVN